MPAPTGGASLSPLSITFPPEADVRWTSAGRRIALVLSPARGLERAAAGESPLLGESCVTAAGSLTVTPVDALRAVSAGVEQRWVTALELPLFFWEVESKDGGAVGLEATLAPGWIAEHGAADTGQAEGGLHFADALGRGLLVQVDDGDAALRTFSADGVQRVAVGGTGRVRLVIIASEDAADLSRTRDLLLRRGFAGLRAQRAQHARLIHDCGTALSTPLPALDEAFEWARIGADEILGRRVAPYERAAAPDFAALLRRPREYAIANPSGFIESVLRQLWGIGPDRSRAELRLAPRLPEGWARMSVSRLRAGSATLDCALGRRSGQVTVRLRRRTGRAVSAAVTLPGFTTTGIAIDGVSVGGREARFDATGEHEVVFDLAE